MSFGQVWRTSEASFWDGMWAKHKDSPMTAELLDRAMAAESICEVGCGFGHFLQAMINRGWRGRFVGFEMSKSGVDRIRQRCLAAKIEHEVRPGDFLEWCGDLGVEGLLPECELALCRGVVQHQSHWMPMTLGMLRIAPTALVGIGYVSSGEFHSGPLRGKGHYDVSVSTTMLKREARCVGAPCEIKVFPNTARKCSEALAEFSRREPV
jgi:SAM-dependent methyltransferase